MTSTRSLKKQDSKYFYWGIALLCCTLIFAAIELKYPYFFLRDDNADSYLPEYMYGINCISEGKFPFFCFNTFGGQRFYAIGQTGLFNPLVLFAAAASRLIIGRPDLMMDILAYLSILIGCTGAFFLLKRLGCADVPAVIGAVAWNFNCYNIWEGSSWMVVLYTTSVFPFFLITSLMLLERFSIKNLILATIPRVYMFYLGHPQFFIFAAIFDCIFIGVLCLIKTEKGKKLITLGRLIRDYVIVYVSTTFLSLPLIVPEYQYTQLTSTNDSARTYENILIEMFFDKPAFFVPYLYTDENYSFFYPPYIGYLLAACAIGGIFMLIFLFQEKKLSKYSSLGKVMLAVLPCLVLGYLLLFSRDALKVVWYIPILNRFQYYHRMTIFFAAFAVIFGALSMTIFGERLKAKFKLTDKATPVIAGAVIFVEFLNFGLLYTSTPHLGRGPLYDTSALYDYEYASRLEDGGRYICIGYSLNPYTVNSERRDLSENLNYNLAKLYRIDNISGYAGVLNYGDVIDNNACIGHMNAITGSLFEVYPGIIEEMRTHSVSWYVVSPEYEVITGPYFADYGLLEVTRTEHSIIYYDPYYEPYAYDINGDEVSVIQDVNSLLVNTGEDFPGGTITFNYAYDPNFCCYIDGQIVPITNDPQNWQFKVFCPSGDHSIAVQYEDLTFTICCIIAGEYLVFACVAIAVYKNKTKRRSAKEGLENG